MHKHGLAWCAQTQSELILIQPIKTALVQQISEPGRWRRLSRLGMFSGSLLALPALAGDNFLNLPLEDLLAIEISSAARKVQQVQDVAAAVFVISHEDIERSGARSIPEALRLAPGVEVAHIGINRWAVSVRGFNGRFANKLLVLKDGRSVYSPLFSGVMWEAEDAILGDIERIEVIRGPGAAMWGSNAVNGVINIISRAAGDTPGGQIIASSATDEPASLTVRQGFSAGDGKLRLSAKAFHVAPATTHTGATGNDDWSAGRVTLRGDWPAPDGGRWILSGETFRSRADDRLDLTLTRLGVAAPLQDIGQTNSGSNLLLRREQPLAGGGRIDWQVALETSLINEQTLLRETRNGVAAEFQQRIPLELNELIWGASYRYSRDRIELPDNAGFDRQRRDWGIASVFVHDEYALIADRLRLSGGARLDYDNWSGVQVQPELRLAWTPDAATTWWTALARAARTPARSDLDVPFVLSQTAPAPPFVPAVTVVHEPSAPGALRSEIVNAFEAGWRHRASAQLSFDVAAFIADYSYLLTPATQPARMLAPGLLLVPVASNNAGSARTHGVEIAADWQLNPNWRVQPAYARLSLRSARSADPAALAVQEQLEGRVPRHRASLRSAWTLADGSQFDLWLKYTSSLGNPAVPAYTGLDLRYAVRLGRAMEIAIVGQNLLDRRHPEFVSEYLPIQATEIGRSLMLKATWRF